MVKENGQMNEEQKEAARGIFGRRRQTAAERAIQAREERIKDLLPDETIICNGPNLSSEQLSGI